MKKNLPVYDEEVTFNEELISTTDLKGTITSFNRAFEMVSGFEKSELLNKNHNVIRHPDMPPAAFEDMWRHLKDGKHWMGLVKNRTKKGAYYWVDAYVTPIFEDNKVIGYESVRVKPDADTVDRARKLYKNINKAKRTTVLEWFESFSLMTKSSLLSALSVIVGLMTGLSIDILNSELLSGIFGIFTSLAIIFVGFPLLFKRLNRAVSDSKNAINNPLMAKVYTGKNDEVGQLLLHSKILNAKLRTILTMMGDTAANVETEARQTFESQSSISSAMQSQADQTDQVATAMTEMSSSIQEVAQNASGAAKKTAEVDELAKNTTTEASTAKNGLAEMDKVFDEMVEMISQLDKDAKAITPVIGVISNVAEQTNLLALNAAIEAARAGEHGRGFAVVADEVRTLAIRTQESTNEIASLIDKLSSTMSQTLSGSERLRATAEESNISIEASINSVSSIASHVQELNDLATMIATAVEEQSAVSEDINRNIVRISSDAESVAGSSNQSSHNAENLMNESHKLSNMIRRFRG